MNAAFTEGFARELCGLGSLQKTAGIIGKVLGGAAKKVVGTAVKHPFASIFGALPAITGAGKAFSQRLGAEAGGEASILGTRPFQPSPAFNTNFHELFPHELQPWEKFKLHRNFPKYRETQGPLK